MKRIITLIFGSFVAGSAFSLQPPIDYTKGWTNFGDIDLAKSYQEGVEVRKAREERKDRKKHEKAMQELERLDLEDKQAVINFAKKYPKEIDSLKTVIELNKQLQ